jgi:hypothetical protein
MQVTPLHFTYGSQQMFRQCAGIAEDVLDVIRSFSAVLITLLSFIFLIDVLLFL